MIYNTPPPPLTPLRAAINAAYLCDETEYVEALLEQIPLEQARRDEIETLARSLVIQVREESERHSGVDALLHEYDLSSQEGVLLMCLAEALLRIPDAETADRLIRDKLSNAAWNNHLGQSDSLFVNASTWGLLLTGSFVKLAPEMLNDTSSFLGRLISRSGEPVIRTAVKQAMRAIGHQFVMGETIEDALKRAQNEAPNSGSADYRYSFDMLGEAALTTADAERYCQRYADAITAIAATIDDEMPFFERPGISVKLSAFHPRFEFAQRQRVLNELTPSLLQLARQAKWAGITLTIDAEEAERLDLTLDIFEALCRDESLRDWNGLGLAVQAYQKRALPLIDWLSELAQETGRILPIRLVKGAYWDTEIKSAQEQGLAGYPVFTRKISTDLNYLSCARRILEGGKRFYPQFATHNAHTVASIVVMAGQREYEFQRLHGMGRALYSLLAIDDKTNRSCRIYAPVGDYQILLPYLVRRMLENGANTSFVNRIVDETAPIDEIIADPITELLITADKPHPKIPLPQKIYGEMRTNSNGINLYDRERLNQLDNDLKQALTTPWHVAPMVGGESLAGPQRVIYDPSDHRRSVGTVEEALPEAVESALRLADAAAHDWNSTPVEKRAEILEQAANRLEAHREELMALTIREGGRTLNDALSEVREAVDFCRYYALMARRDFGHAIQLPGITGEQNELSLSGRGLFVCISPWNFPVAIFTGQIVAALAAGNSVIAKPASLTPLCAGRIVTLLHEAGVPVNVLHLLPGAGSKVGEQLLNDPRVAGVAFTGSTAVAQKINLTLAQRPAIIPFIAETGGQNCMIVDSSALAEQVVKDVIGSAFTSAGQRCSALRVLFVQEEVAPRIIELLQGAMQELQIGDPARLSTDIGPVITADAKRKLELHVERLQKEATLIRAIELGAEHQQGSFFAPHAFEINQLEQLQEEIFGPILHVIRYQSNHLKQVVDSINATGYGLTLGIHSRINSTVEYITQHVRCGNTYVNRNLIGAVVGTQPFGGEGLSGTGPKAGGPHYLQRFATERVISVNTAAVGGNATLLSLNDEKN